MKSDYHSNYYVRNKKNYARIRYDDKENAIKIKSERKIENEEKYGKSRNLILVGESDRINGNTPQIIEDKSLQASYAYGFFERGSRVLEGKFANNEFTSEEQKKFGIIDFINGVPENSIKNLKKYPAYSEGRIYQMGKSAYDYCIENNISIESYIKKMEVIYPEIKTPPFIEGYETRKNELSRKIGHK